MIAFVIKLIITVVLSILAGKSAAISKVEDCGGEKIDSKAFGAIIALGGVSGVIAMALPLAWMIQVIFIVTYGVLQRLNTEGRHRATSWSILSLLSGIMLVLGMIRWQNEIGGIRLWMVGVGVLFSAIPILIGLYKGISLEYLKKEESDETETSKKIVAFATQHKKTLAAAVFVSICVAGLVTAVFWAAS